MLTMQSETMTGLLYSTDRLASVHAQGTGVFLFPCLSLLSAGKQQSRATEMQSSHPIPTSVLIKPPNLLTGSQLWSLGEDLFGDL